MEIKNKKITILGAVRSGVGAAKLAKKLGAVPFVSDIAPKEKLVEYLSALDKSGISYETDHHTDKIFDCDYLVASPGIPGTADVLVKARQKNINVMSELEFASRFCKGIIIAITGTNGKTTTTSLCAHVLNQSGLKAYAAGNIGLAFSEVVQEIKEDEYVALEVSSFQLDQIENFKPKFSVILNITPDHLDRYENDFNKYIHSKLQIIRNQDESDYFISNADDINIPEEIENKKVTRINFSFDPLLSIGSYYENGRLYFRRDREAEEVCNAGDLSLKGEHNIANALAVLAVTKILRIPNIKIKNAFINFPGVEHRLEFVRELYGVKYINDSKATNVDSVFHALKSFNQPIYLILGGQDKGNDYNMIKSLVQKNVVKIYAIGSSSNKVFDFFNHVIPVEVKDSLEECVKSGRKEAGKNEIVLLSPACASFDMFINYEHRGRIFKEAVSHLY